jgi:CheY-like chemotaxis protein
MAVLLIAEDDIDVATVLERLFRRDGFAVFTAADGTTALQTARREHPDVVLTDMDMPGLTGLQLCRAIRDDPVIRDVPVAILSGTLHHGDPGIAEASVCGLNRTRAERARPPRSSGGSVAMPAGRRPGLTPSPDRDLRPTHAARTAMVDGHQPWEG